MRGDPNNPAFALPPRESIAGTPAGQGPYTQEQHLEMRRRAMAMNDTCAMLVLFITRPPLSLSEADRLRRMGGTHNPIEQHACPVCAFGDTWADVIAPNGEMLRMRR